MSIIGAKIRITGIVQGVGFRPFIHKEVQRFSLNGYIRNTYEGVELELEGEEHDLEEFIDVIEEEHPRLAFIDNIKVEKYQILKKYNGFKIIDSLPGMERQTLISPDIGICDDCLKELFDPSDRRYRYPFINCTNCGPRFTIIKDIPYDRNKTSMADFKMCKDCEREYLNIEDRRYHAQPDCCPECGPGVWFIENDTEGSHRDLFKRCITGDDAIKKAITYLSSGKIVAVKGLGGFHLACLMDDETLAGELRKRKRRDEKPFAVMVKDAETAKKYCEVSKQEEKALTSFRRPIVLLKKKSFNSFRYISENNYIGIMLPYTPLHYLLFDFESAESNTMKADGNGISDSDHKQNKRGNVYDALIMTSANLSDEPVIYKNDEAIEKLSGIADGFLMHDREIVTRCDDSLQWIVDGKEYPVRRSRGYVPSPVRIDEIINDQSTGTDEKKGTDDQSPDINRRMFNKDVFIPDILACGAEQKAGFALLKGNDVFLSQHIGDMKNMETLQHYEQQISHFEKMFSIKPSVIACDLHPDYLSTEYAKKRAAMGYAGDPSGYVLQDNVKNQIINRGSIQLVQVQHHHAHMASCMADNGIHEPCIGIIWDGTGLGCVTKHETGKELKPDGTIWGGEFLVGDYKSFKRVGSLLPFRLPGGDKAAKELWRCALSVLFTSFEDLSVFCADYCTEPDITEKNWRISLPGFEDVQNRSLPAVFNRYGTEKIRALKMMLDNDLNSPVCTSMGRLFDAAASILSMCDEVSYEGQGAVLLEAEVDRHPSQEVYPYDIIKTDILRFDFRPMIRAMSEDNTGSRASKFINTLIKMAADMTKKISEESGIRKVVLSGGTFQNQYLLKGLKELLAKEGFQVYHHSRVSANDEGIAFGQAAVATEIIKTTYMP